MRKVNEVIKKVTNKSVERVTGYHIFVVDVNKDARGGNLLFLISRGNVHRSIKLTRL